MQRTHHTPVLARKKFCRLCEPTAATAAVSPEGRCHRPIECPLPNPPPLHVRHAALRLHQYCTGTALVLHRYYTGTAPGRHRPGPSCCRQRGCPGGSRGRTASTEPAPRRGTAPPPPAGGAVSALWEGEVPWWNIAQSACVGARTNTASGLYGKPWWSGGGSTSHPPPNRVLGTPIQPCAAYTKMAGEDRDKRLKRIQMKNIYVYKKHINIEDDEKE